MSTLHWEHCDENSEFFFPTLHQHWQNGNTTILGHLRFANDSRDLANTYPIQRILVQYYFPVTMMIKLKY